MSIAEKLQTIAENEQKVYAAGKFSILDKSKYMRPTVSDEVVAVNDVSGLEHSLGISVSSKNLFDISKSNGFISQYAGLSTYIEDDKIIVECTASARSGSLYLGELNTGTYSVSVTATKSTGEDFYMTSIAVGESIDALTTLTTSSLNKATFTLTDNQKVWVRCAGFASTYSPFTISEILLERNSVNTSYTPYIEDFSEVTVSRYGKNLFDLSKASDISNWTKINSSYRYFPIKVKKGVPISVSFSYKESIVGTNYINIGSSYNLDGTQGNWYASLLNQSTQVNEKCFVPTEDTIYIIANLTWDSTISAATMGNFITNVGVDLQLEVSTAPTDYAAYVEPQSVTANADGTVEGLMSLSPNMTLSTDTDGVVINCQYYRDIDTYIDNLMIDVATSGGE